MFCGKGKEAGPLSKEHFVPRGLWGGIRPPFTKTVPAHVECNGRYAEDNEYFRMVMAQEIGAIGHQEARQVYEGPLVRMANNRPGQLLRQANDFAFRPLTTPMGIYLGYQPTFTIDLRRIERVLQNVVKGMFYSLTEKRLGDDRSILVWGVGEILDENTRYFVDRMVGWQSFGDDVFMCRYGFAEGMKDIACLMRFYRCRTFFAASLRAKVNSNSPEASADIPLRE